MRHLVTIIIPAFNVKDYIEKTLSSVLSQSWHELQIILVDDGSTDGTTQICERYAAEDGRIEFIKKENGGVSSARNVALTRVRGEYVTFVDADDEIYPQCVEQMLLAMLNRDADGVQTGMAIDGQDDLISDKETLFTEEDICAEVLSLGRINAYLCGKMFKSALLFELSFKERLITGEDFVLMYHVLKRCKRFAVIPERGYHYVWRDDACTKRKINPACILTLDELETMRSDEKTPRLKTAWGVYLSSFATFLLVRAVQAEQFPEWYPRLRKVSIEYFWKPHREYRTPPKRRMHLMMMTFCPHVYYAMLRRA